MIVPDVCILCPNEIIRENRRSSPSKCRRVNLQKGGKFQLLLRRFRSFPAAHLPNFQNLRKSETNRLRSESTTRPCGLAKRFVSSPNPNNRIFICGMIRFDRNKFSRFKTADNSFDDVLKRIILRFDFQKSN